MNPNDSDASRFKSAATDRRGERDLDDLLVHVARGKAQAFAAVYDRLVGPVCGVIRRVLRDPSQSEEVTQEVLLEVWRTATRFDPAVGGAATWVMTIAHRRAIDRVRSTTAAADREHKTAEVHTPRDEAAGGGRWGGESEPGRRTGATLPGRAHRRAARVDHPGLLRRLQLPSGVRAAQGHPWRDQDQDPLRPHPEPRLPGGELTCVSSGTTRTRCPAPTPSTRWSRGPNATGSPATSTGARRAPARYADPAR